MERLVHDPARARQMGLAGKSAVAQITWDHVAGTLSAALGFNTAVIP